MHLTTQNKWLRSILKHLRWTALYCLCLVMLDGVIVVSDMRLGRYYGEEYRKLASVACIPEVWKDSLQASWGSSRHTTYSVIQT
eukprot:scaffold6242_cov168-Amphora_coffeaeformis.AAC.6